MATATFIKAKKVKLLKVKIPQFYLTGKSAKKLDQRVEESLKEYRAGKTKKINSLADLM